MSIFLDAKNSNKLSFFSIISGSLPLMIIRLVNVFALVVLNAIGMVAHASEAKQDLHVVVDSISFEDYWIYPDDQYASSVDSIYRDFFSESKSVLKLLDTSGYSSSADFIPLFSEQEVKKRMALLDSTTPLAMEYNKYTARMITFYLTKRRKMLARVLGMSSLYFPLFEQELAKAQLPMELKYLAVVESALLNVVRSRAGAVGLWQFMYNTGIYLGMHIDSYIDERQDPMMSTKYAVKYLQYLHGLYDDWYMALAAYNAGPGNVNKAIRRSGGKRTFWEIYRFLPRETRSYVPAFIAVNYAMNYTQEHNIRPVSVKYHYHDVDTVHLNKAVSFDQISEVLCIPIEELQFLNPQYKLAFIPVNKQLRRDYPLVLPYNLVGDFVVNEQAIYHYNDNWKGLQELGQDTIETEREKTHVVRSGDNLGSIANTYGVSVKSIKSWNKIKGNLIYPKQKLSIRMKGKTIIPKSSDPSQEYVYYIVKKGDSLSGIASRYKGVSMRTISRLNGLTEKVTLYPGTKLKIKKIKRRE
jgi:membrane-bound lytic murein transglycosylase D